MSERPLMMQIACIAENAYWRHTGVMLHTLLSRHRGEAVAVHVLHGDRAPEVERARLRQMTEGFGVPLRFLEVSAARIAGFPGVWFPRSVWYRVLLPEMLPQLDKILYLDSDMLVVDSLRPLWETDLGRNALGAVSNPLHPALREYPRSLGLEPSEYFNSGVLLMNLKRMREDQAAERLLEIAQRNPGHTCPDQDALSVFYRDARLPLHPRWNFQVPLFDLRPQQTPFGRQELEEARRAPAIVHYSGPFKPWHYLSRYPYSELYFEHARQTPWPAMEPEGRTRVNRVLRHLPTNWVWHYFRTYAWAHRVIKPWVKPVRDALRRMLARKPAAVGPRP